jgi:hypothetical protein
MYCNRCGTGKPMLIMMNTTRPERESILTRYNCTECGMWCTVIYEPKDIVWHSTPEPSIDNVRVDQGQDQSNTGENLYFVDGQWKKTK